MLIRGEFRKLATIRGPWVLLACGPLIVIAGVTGLIVSGGDVHDRSVQNAALAHVSLAGLLTLIFGILAVAGEYRHRTITDTYLGEPARGRVLAAKLVVHGAVGAVAGLVSAGVAVATTAIWWTVKGGALSLSGADAWRTILGGAAVNLAFAMIGVGVGALVRNVVVAVAVALAWIAVIEEIVGQLIGTGLARWLPFAAGEALGRTATGGLPQWAGGLVLLGYTAAFAVAALLITLRRDVT